MKINELMFINRKLTALNLDFKKQNVQKSIEMKIL